MSFKTTAVLVLWCDGHIQLVYYNTEVPKVSSNMNVSCHQKDKKSLNVIEPKFRRYSLIMSMYTISHTSHNQFCNPTTVLSCQLTYMLWVENMGLFPMSSIHPTRWKSRISIIGQLLTVGHQSHSYKFSLTATMLAAATHSATQTSSCHVEQLGLWESNVHSCLIYHPFIFLTVSSTTATTKPSLL